MMVLDKGCYNCGRYVPYGEVPKECAGCLGPAMRAWVPIEPLPSRPRAVGTL